MTSGDPARKERVIGALVGAIVGDALGAPFEFGPAKAFSSEFPVPVLTGAGEMKGGHPWGPGEWTDDSQLTLLVAESLREWDELNEGDVFGRFQEWAHAGPKDIGVQTHAVLSSALPWNQAAKAYVEAGHLAAGNGSLMRTMPAAIRFSLDGQAITMEMARRLSALTHGDPAAGEGCAIYHELVRVALEGDDPLEALPDALAKLAPSHQSKWKQVLAKDWSPGDASESNGAVWPALGIAVWALRNGWTFERGLREVIDLGGDTDTVACITGGLLGAVRGIGSIPSRWVTPLHGELIGHENSGLRIGDLQALALALDGQKPSGGEATDGCSKGPTQVAPGLWAANLDGAQTIHQSCMIISLCRTWGLFDQYPHRREVYLVDSDHEAANACLSEVVADVLDTIEACHHEGQDVLVHCHGGASRTGLILRAWLMRKNPEMSVQDALEKALDLWPHTATWNQRFEDFLSFLSIGADG